MKYNRIILLVFILYLFVSSFVMAGELSGEEIINRAENLSSVDDLSVEIEMRIIKSGRERSRELSMIIMENEDGSEKSLIRFLSPVDIRGTGFLSIINPESANEQYLYLPALGKPRRISSEDRGGQFMGSDFTYEDISPDKEDYEHKIINSVFENEQEVYVVESIPKTEKLKKDLGFAKKISYISKDQFFLIRAEYLSEKGEQIRRLEVSDYKQIIDEFWFGTYMLMEDLIKESKTVLVYKNIVANTGVDESYFTIRELSRPVR